MAAPTIQDERCIARNMPFHISRRRGTIIACRLTSALTQNRMQKSICLLVELDQAEPSKQAQVIRYECAHTGEVDRILELYNASHESDLWGRSIELAQTSDKQYVQVLPRSRQAPASEPASKPVTICQPAYRT